MQLKGLRWWVIALIALATVINYIDRQALSVLWPDIVEDLFPDESALERKQIYANITVVFIFSYAFGQAIFGKIFDWIGTRLGFVLSIGVWSIATALHAFAQGALSFSISRPLSGFRSAPVLVGDIESESTKGLGAFSSGVTSPCVDRESGTARARRGCGCCCPARALCKPLPGIFFGSPFPPRAPVATQHTTKHASDVINNRPVATQHTTHSTQHATRNTTRIRFT